MKYRGRYPSAKFRELSLSDRPREKLINQGEESLSDVELLALVINTGTRKKDVLKVATEIIQRFTLHNLGQVESRELLGVDGIGWAKIARIRAVCELGRRIHQPALIDRPVISGVEEAVAEVRGLANKSREHLVALYLNARHELLSKEVVTIGSLNQNVVQPRDVFKPAFQWPCTYLIISHNHPSGDPTPSDADVSFTERIRQAGGLLGLQLLDHIIVATNGYYSFNQDGKW